jgi:uncharacterized protein YndB with AHSA1/START domain
MTKKRITIERTFDAPVEDVWELWTTKDGIESWWGPNGFMVKVKKIDVRPGGNLEYAMIAVGADEIAYMKKAGMPLSTDHCITYTEVTPPRRLVYTHPVDFIPGVAAYDVETMVELHATATSVRLVLTIDAMHDQHWTDMAVMGWESELGKLAKVLQGVTA